MLYHLVRLSGHAVEWRDCVVGRDSEGRPSTVRYDRLTPLLLAQVQRQEEEIAKLGAVTGELQPRPSRPVTGRRGRGFSGP